MAFMPMMIPLKRPPYLHGPEKVAALCETTISKFDYSITDELLLTVISNLVVAHSKHIDFPIVGKGRYINQVA
jgi:hypothetical protein